MTEENQEELEEYEVVELESDQGDIEEFVIIDRVQIKGKDYVVMSLLEDVENMETMTPDEIDEYYGEDDSILVLMRQEGNDYVELEDSEYEEIKDELDQLIEKMF